MLKQDGRSNHGILKSVFCFVLNYMIITGPETLFFLKVMNTTFKLAGTQRLVILVYVCVCVCLVNML